MWGDGLTLPDQLTMHEMTRLLASGSEQLADIPIYITERGTAMSAKLFRDYYWTRALRSIGIDADPHQTRHWFVTNALRTIERTSKSDAELRRKKEELIQYMAWRSGERTLRAYEHVQRVDDFAATLNSIHRSMQRRETAAARNALPRTRRCAKQPPNLRWLIATWRFYWEKTVTIEESVCQIRSLTGKGRSKCIPIPNELIAPLCAALWEAGINPSTAAIIRCMPELNVRAVRDGTVAWRMATGLPRKGPRWLHFPYQHPHELAELLPSEIITAPLTCLDAASDGRWPAPPARVLTYIAHIENRSLREIAMLFALLKPELGEGPLCSVICSFAAPLTTMMAEEKIDDIRTVDPDDFLIRICDAQAGKSLSQFQRFRFVRVWNRVSNALEAYADRLTELQLERMKPFLLRPLTKRSRMLRYRTSVVLLEHGQNAVKAKTEVVHSQFYQLRFTAQVRLNQARRLYQAASGAHHSCRS